MLAESQAASTGWLAFLVLVVASAAMLPSVAGCLRHRLPAARRLPRPVPPLRFGRSPEVRRSPRHAVAFHRTYLTSALFSGVGLVLIAYVSALDRLELGGLLVALGFVMPVLVVALHCRLRDHGGRPRA